MHLAPGWLGRNICAPKPPPPPPLSRPCTINKGAFCQSSRHHAVRPFPHQGLLFSCWRDCPLLQTAVITCRRHHLCMLQDKTLKLEQMLAERELKIAQLTGQLKAASSATSAAPASVPNQDIASGPHEDGGRTPAISAFDGMSDLKLEFQGQIMKLQQYIEANNLRHVDPLGISSRPPHPPPPGSPPPSLTSLIPRAFHHPSLLSCPASVLFLHRAAAGRGQVSALGYNPTSVVA